MGARTTDVGENIWLAIVDLAVLATMQQVGQILPDLLSVTCEQRGPRGEVN